MRAAQTIMIPFVFPTQACAVLNNNNNNNEKNNDNNNNNNINIQNFGSCSIYIQLKFARIVSLFVISWTIPAN